VGEVRKRDVIALLDRVRERGLPIMANQVLAAVQGRIRLTRLPYEA
jgi:hypothetical protein